MTSRMLVVSEDSEELQRVCQLIALNDQPIPTRADSPQACVYGDDTPHTGRISLVGASL